MPPAQAPRVTTDKTFPKFPKTSLPRVEFARQAQGTTIASEKMPKANKHKRNGASGAQDSPYAAPTAKSNAIFKMNTDLGQHILKNPGIAQAIVDKADLKQSDVSR